MLDLDTILNATQKVGFPIAIIIIVFLLIFKILKCSDWHFTISHRYNNEDSDTRESCGSKNSKLKVSPMLLLLVYFLRNHNLFSRGNDDRDC